MGKITVKHYLNKNIKYLDINTNEVEHPIYLQITAKRKTTQIRSLTEYLMTESDFEKYELFKYPKFNSNFDSNNKAKTKEFSNEVNFEELQEEILTVSEILDYCINSKNIEFGKLKPLIIFYSKFIQFEFGKYVYELNLFPALIENKKTAAISMYLKSEMNPFDFIGIFKKTTNFDIMGILTNEQKKNIIGFNKFLDIGTKSSYDKLINWYNGTAKKYYIENISINNDTKDFEIFDYINSFAENVENNLFIELKNNK